MKWTPGTIKLTAVKLHFVILLAEEPAWAGYLKENIEDKYVKTHEAPSNKILIAAQNPQYSNLCNYSANSYTTYGGKSISWNTGEK